MNTLVQTNRCDNAGLERFEVNLYNFVEGHQPLLLPGKETVATIQRVDQINFDADNLNLKKLIDELILENSKGWMMNRYQAGSVSSIKIGARNRDGSPQRVTAGYAFSSMGKRYGGNVTLNFSNGIPNCLYFSDAPQTCRHPSRRVINRYEKGLYSQ